jgi:hypothetical protein
MAKLVLRPTLGDLERSAVEEYITAVRAKRMAATVEYFATKNRKLELRQGAVSERINKKIEMLHKAIVALERAEGRVDDYLAEIQELQNEHDQLGAGVTEVSDD